MKKKTQKTAQNKGFERLVFFILGGIVGFINGFFGGGGGTIGVPLLEKALNIDNKKAHATCLALILPLTMISSMIYIFYGTVENQALLFVGIGTIVGGVIGSLLLKILPSEIVRIIFVIILLSGGIRMIVW